MTDIPRESVEFVAVSVAVDGTAADASAVELAVAPTSERPTVWAPPTTLGDEIGYVTGTLPAGSYTVWARVTTGGLEKPVLNCGRLTIT